MWETWASENTVKKTTFQVNVICDWIVLTLMTRKQHYKEQKYTYVDDFGLVSIYLHLTF